jgi:NADP-dependent 3-hydroxy acid dehydrogenase YdfG
MLAPGTFSSSTVLLAGSEIGDGFALRAAQPGATVALAGRYKSLLQASARAEGRFYRISPSLPRIRLSWWLVIG